MAWSVWYESNQKRFEVDSGFGLGTRLCLNSSVISGMTDEEIVEVARWFVGHAREIDAIHTGDECNYDPQFISTDDLYLILNGELALDRIREGAKKELAHRQGREKRVIRALSPEHRNIKSGYIYLAYSETQHYKIGKSKGPIDRINVFNTEMPVEVTMLHCFETDDMSMAEAILHKSFTDKRVKGEWFELALEDIEAIKAITAYRNGIFIKG